MHLPFKKIQNLDLILKKSLKQQLGSDTTRNMGSEVPSVGIDLQQKGYRNIPNERHVTELRTHMIVILKPKLEIKRLVLLIQ